MATTCCPAASATTCSSAVPARTSSMEGRAATSSSSNLVRMGLPIERIAEAFSRHDFTAASPSLAEDVEWDLVGDRRVTGRAAVVATCAESAAHLATVTTTFERFRVLSGPGFAVVDSVAEYAA